SMRKRSPRNLGTQSRPRVGSLGLEAANVHGRKGNGINYMPSYDPNDVEVYADSLNALNDVPFPLLEQLEACADEKQLYIQAFLVMGTEEAKEDEVKALVNHASGSTFSTGCGADQFIVAPSIPYVGDVGETTKESATAEEVKIIESDVNVLTRTVRYPATPSPSTFASGASAFALVPPTFQDQNPFLRDKLDRSIGWWKRIFKKRSKKKAKNKQIQAREGKDQVKSKITKSAGNVNLPTSKSIFSAIRNRAVEAWKHSDFLCHNYVLNGLVDSLYDVYCKTTIAKELWKSLERKYKTEDAGIKKIYRNLVEFL
ncbi:hypothetical protein Tco_0693690, partial [Tanacetum coccineum]